MPSRASWDKITLFEEFDTKGNRLFGKMACADRMPDPPKPGYFLKDGSFAVVSKNILRSKTGSLVCKFRPGSSVKVL